MTGYPTIKVFASWLGESPEDYRGQRDASGVVADAYRRLDAAGVSPDVPQLLARADLDARCGPGSVKICVVAALPHILDSGKAGREAYLQTLADVALAQRGKPFSVLWTAAGDHPALEAALGFTFGYPAVAALNVNKRAAATMAGAVDGSGIAAFLDKVARGKGVRALGEMPPLETAAAWDGQEQAAEEEEFSLEDLGLDF